MHWSTRRRALVVLALLILLVVAPIIAYADYGSGSFRDSDGLSCNWTSSGSGSYTTADVRCSGYVNVSKSYTCTNFGYSWDCTSANVRIGY